MAVLEASDWPAGAKSYMHARSRGDGSVALKHGTSNSHFADGQNDNDRLREPSFHGLRVPCAAIGALFAGVDGTTIVLASLVGATGYQFLISGAPWNLHFHIGAGVANVFYVPGKAMLCGLGGMVGVFVMIVSIGSAPKTAAGFAREGCGGKWILTGEDLRPDADARTFDWEKDRTY